MARTVILIATAALLLAGACGRGEPGGAPAAPPAKAEPARTEAPAKADAASPAPAAVKPAAPAPVAAKPAAPATPVAAAPAKPAAPAAEAIPAKPAPGPAAPAAEAKPAPSAPVAVPGPGKVVYPASFGKVTFDHAAHARRQACTDCHPGKPPRKIVLGKEAAHTLCKGCHEAKAAGPAKCAGCHVKG